MAETVSGVPVTKVFRMRVDPTESFVEVIHAGRIHGTYMGSPIDHSIARFFEDIAEQGRTVVAVVQSATPGVSFVVTRLEVT